MITDEGLTQDIAAELAWDPSVTATDLGVTAKDGIITLNGHATRFAQKYAAEAAARWVDGLKSV